MTFTVTVMGAAVMAEMVSQAQEQEIEMAGKTKKKKSMSQAARIAKAYTKGAKLGGKPPKGSKKSKKYSFRAKK